MNIIQISDKILDAINALMEYLMGILFLALVCITFQEVIRRYLFNDPTHWASELSRFLLIWMTFTGACIVTRLVAHLTMGFTIHRFVNKSMSKFIKVFISAAARGQHDRSDLLQREGDSAGRIPSRPHDGYSHVLPLGGTSL